LLTSGDLNAAIQSLKPLDLSDFKSKFAEHILNALEVGTALGRSLIVKKSEHFGESVVAKNVASDWFICGKGPVSVSFDIVPKAALEYLQQKSIELSGEESKYVLDGVKNRLEAAMKEGKTVEDFRNEINSMFDSLGVTRLSQQRIDLVFRMNTFAAYNVGKMNQVSDMLDRFPLAYLSAIHDSHAREAHKDNEGYYKSDKVPIPPYDYNCRCSVRYIHISQLTGEEKVYDTPPYPDAIVFNQRSV